MTFIARAVLNTQVGIITIPNTGPGSSPQHTDFTVINSAYVRIIYNLFEINGNDSECETYVGLTVSIIDAVTIRVTAARGVNLIGDVPTVSHIQVIDLNPFFIRSIQRGNGTTVISSVNINQYQLDNLGATFTTSNNNYSSSSNGVVLTDATHITQTGLGTAYWQLIEGK